MAQAHDEVEPDLSHIHWSFPEAIAANPARSLATADLAMDYFAYSPFWDTESNNNVLRTQRRIEQPHYGHAEEKLELEAFKSGFEYIVAHARPPEMFIIHRRDVQPDGRRDQVSAIYWILQDRIYPTPTLYDIMASRTKNAAHLISETFSTLSALHPPSNPRTSNTWRSLPPSAERRPPPQAGAGPGATPAGLDVEMLDPKEAENGDKEEEGQEEEPDWNLFHALQSTRGAMEDLQSLARQPPPAPSAERGGTSIVGDSSSTLPPASTFTGTPGASSRIATPAAGHGVTVPGRLRAPSGLGQSHHVASSPLAR